MLNAAFGLWNAILREGDTYRDKTKGYFLWNYDEHIVIEKRFFRKMKPHTFTTYHIFNEIFRHVVGPNSQIFKSPKISIGDVLMLRQMIMQHFL